MYLVLTQLHKSHKSSSSTEITCILRYPNFNYQVHASPILFPIMSQINLVHALSYLFKVYFNIILTPVPVSLAKSPFPSSFLTKPLDDFYP
jgi:hypothetical protein